MKIYEMGRVLAAFVLAICVASAAPVPVYAAEAPVLTVDAKASCIMEAETGTVLYENRSNDRLAPASVTKVMTILLIYEAIDDGRIGMDDIVTVSEYASGMGGSQVFLEPMEKQTVRDLVKSVVIASANDAAVAMAEYIGGSEESFVDMMNKKAAALGMKDTSFQNACGLDADGHFTSAHDIALMSRELWMAHPDAFEYTTTWMDSITHTTARGATEFGLTNTNKLVRWYDGATGLKTGSTSKAGYCLSGTAERDGLKLIAVVLGAPAPTVRFQEVMKMLDYGFAHFAIASGDEAGTVVGEVDVAKGRRDSVPVMVKEKVSAVTAKGNSEVTAQITLAEGVAAPVAVGDEVGEIVYSHGGKELGRSPIVAAEPAERATVGDAFMRILQMTAE